MKSKKRRIIAILLSIAIVFCGTGANYQKASAVGIVGALTSPVVTIPIGCVILIGVLGATTLFLPTGTEVQNAIESGEIAEIHQQITEAGEQIAKDFEAHALQAIENNQNATQTEAQQSAQVRETLNDFYESLKAGVIDVSSDAWDWIRSFINSIYESYDSDYTINPYGTIGDYPILGNGIYEVQDREYSNGDYAVYEMMVENFEYADTDAIPIITHKNGTVVARDYNTGELLKVSMTYKIRRKHVSAEGEVTLPSWGSEKTVDGAWTIASDLWYSGYTMIIPQWKSDAGIDTTVDAPPGTTDIPGVANPGAYGLHGQDCLVSGDTTAWDLGNPLGPQHPVQLNSEIPLGYESWEELISAIQSGAISWSDVASALGIIGIESTATNTSEVDRTDIENIDVVVPGAIPISYPEAIDSAIEDAINNNVEEETTQTDVKYEKTNFILDFKDLFPFCIPFDIYHFFKLLSAEPVAPVVHYKFYVNKTKYYTININLNKFNSVAEILRTMELLIFIVGLAYVTRNMIRG